MRTNAGLSLILMLLSGGTAAAYGSAACESLSYQRNSIYKQAGYCFHTAAQIRNFGNAGCRYDNQADVPLSPNARQAINAILRDEQRSGCRY